LNCYDEILVNSETTKKDLIMHLGVPEELITVTFLGIDHRFVPMNDQSQNQRVREKFNLPESYLLFAGTLEPRKNIPRLLEAYSRGRAGEVFKLVITGKKGWLYREVFETIRRLDLQEKVVFTGFVDDEDLPSLYSMAKVFIYPSLYEGFGLPALEAMACGVPVITSNVPSLVEVVGEAAVLVNPLDVEALAQSIDEVVFNHVTHDRLCQASLVRAQNFTWENPKLRVAASPDIS
jgi:glycosyltransferase involved in cell wall biosynthesis